MTATLRGVIAALKTTYDIVGIARTLLDGKGEVQFRAFPYPITVDRNNIVNVAGIIGRLMRSGWRFCEVNNDDLIFEKDGLRVVFTDIGWYDDEPFDEMYGHFEFNGKTVLDVGGFIGDTAIFFHKRGAKKIIVYEPVPEMFRILQKNIALNNIIAELYNVGVAEYTGEMIVSYNRLDYYFGGLPGHKKKIIKVVAIEDILGCNADIAKFDCEGCELSLLNISDESLRQISTYIIECHYGTKQILEKFKGAGFTCRIVFQWGFENGIIIASNQKI